MIFFIFYRPQLLLYTIYVLVAVSHDLRENRLLDGQSLIANDNVLLAYDYRNKSCNAHITNFSIPILNQQEH